MALRDCCATQLNHPVARSEFIQDAFKSRSLVHTDVPLSSYPIVTSERVAIVHLCPLYPGESEVSHVHKPVFLPGVE